MSLVFNRNFDLELAREDQQTNRIARMCHTPEDLAEAVAEARIAAYAEGQSAGYAEGLSAAATSHQARCAATLDTLTPQIVSLIDAADTHRATLEAQLLDFAISVCEQVFPELLRRRAHERALAQLRRALSVGLGSATLKVALSPTAVALLRADLDRAITENGLQGRVEVCADPELCDGDVRVNWDSGTLEYSFATLCDRILNLLRDARTTLPTPLLER